MIALKECEKLESVTLVGSSKFTGKGIKHLKGLPRLYDLQIFVGNGLDGESLRHLPDLPHLRSFSLKNVPDDQALANIGKAEQLVHLELFGSQRCTTLEPLSKLKSLESLTLHRFELTGNAMEYQHLSSLAKLNTLVIYGGSFDDSAMQAIGKLTELRYLYADSSAVSDDGLQHLSNLTHLRTLRLSYAKIRGDGLVHLYGLSNLQGAFVSQASEESKNALRKALPRCQVY